MENELEEYVEYSETSSMNGDIEIGKFTSSDNFPELWDIEMETLQIEDNIGKVKHNLKSETNYISDPYLEDYIDSENETEESLINKNAEDENGCLFPPLWELELEIFNCDSAINVDYMRKTMESDNVTSSAMDSSVATNSSKIVTGRQTLVQESTFNSSNKDISDTGLMFENLMISNPFHTAQYVLDDIPCELKSLKIN